MLSENLYKTINKSNSRHVRIKYCSNPALIFTNYWIKDIIKLNKASSIRDMGLIMGSVMKKLEGTADGKIVKMLVQEELS